MAALYKSKILKACGNEKMLNELLQEILFLQNEGIMFNLKGKTINVRFILAVITGDNLGINSVLNFPKSFSAHYYCRFCTEKREQTEKLSSENIASIRIPESYNRDVENGIQRDSMFNVIPGFHVTENVAVDLMQDIYEGIAHYNITQILSYFIGIKSFTLKDLNSMKENFSWDNRYTFKAITTKHLQRKNLIRQPEKCEI